MAKLILDTLRKDLGKSGSGSRGGEKVPMLERMMLFTKEVVKGF